MPGRRSANHLQTQPTITGIILKNLATGFRRLAIAAGLAGLAIVPPAGYGFTQHAGGPLGNPLPMGHEWITRMSAIELLNGNVDPNPDPDDPRKTWPGTQGRAKNVNVSAAAREVARIKGTTTKEDTYAATYKFVWDAIIGERWVDLGGHNYTNSSFFYAYNCLDLVTQEAPDVQYDHYMRKPDDNGSAGGLRAAQASSARFVDYFVAAATAPAGAMEVWDGGGYAALVTVDRNYFLLGRALHLFEDSFSPDHTVRSDQDRYEKVRQVKSYLCASGSEQHAHPSGIPPYENGDVIWLPKSKGGGTGWSTYKASNMKDVALVAAEASKDVWAAFIRTMALPSDQRAASARREAQAVADQWLAVRDKDETLTWYRDPAHRLATYVVSNDRNDDGGNGQSQAACMARDWKGASQQSKLDEFAAGRRVCLYNMLPTWGNENEIDRQLKSPYNWQWRNADHAFLQPPADWQPGNPVYVDVKIANRVNGVFLRQESNYIYNDPGPGTVQFSVPLPPDAQATTQSFKIKVTDQPDYYLNRASTSTGRVDIYNSSYKGDFRFERRADGYFNIYNTYDKQYMFMDTNGKTYINSDGQPGNTNAQWRIDGIPEPYPMNATYRISTTAYQIGSNAAGKLITTRYQGMDTMLTLERQADGSYTIKTPAGFIRSNDGDSTLFYDKQSGSKFFLDEQLDGKYLVRGTNGGFWRMDRPQNLIRTDAHADCPMDPCNPVLTGPDDRHDIPAECKAAPPKVCARGTPIDLVRQWQ